MGRACFLAFPATDAGIGPPQAVQTEMGRYGEEEPKRADSPADRPVHEHRENKEQEKHQKANRQGQREEFVDPGVVNQVDVIKGTCNGCDKDTQPEAFKVLCLFYIDLFPRYVPCESPAPSRPGRDGRRRSCQQRARARPLPGSRLYRGPGSGRKSRC